MKAIVLVAHGTVERLEELPAFLANIRRGHPAPEEVVREVRRRYEAIGGRSPLNDLTRSLANKLEAALGVKTRMANRLWDPYPKEVLARLAAEGVRRVCVVPLAQHSAAVYGAAVREAAAPLGLEVVCAPNWGRSEALVDAFATAAREALADLPREATRLVLTAHSLPLAVIKAGDAYADEVRASADLVLERLGPSAPEHALCYQSQGMGGGEWLGPDLFATLDAIARGGARHVVVAPIGFLTDHVEILYDLDIEARAKAAERGLELRRARSLNDSDALVRALVEVARPLLAESV
jgi:ferrochelatase